jgi:hypothetical protein
MEQDIDNLLDEEQLRARLRNGEWVRHNSAVLVLHGVGSQRPLETLDAFARGLIETYTEYGCIDKKTLRLSHHLAKKPTGQNGHWFDNFIRIQREGDPNHIDLYEYYWAHYSEHRVTLDAMQSWVEKTYKGAKNFYAQQSIGEQHGDKSPFFDENGCFIPWRYRISLILAMQLIPSLTHLANWSLEMLRKIPVAGGFVVLPWAEKLRDSIFNQICNVAGDVVVYNTRDPKAEFYALRKKILEGSVNAVRYLVEPIGGQDGNKLRYDHVVVAGHSLGSQIAYDAINRLTHLIIEDELIGVSPNGALDLADKGDKKISDVLCGLVTFGCPLDKIAFFLRERAKEDAYFRAQMLAHFHAFKQKQWDSDAENANNVCGHTPEVKALPFKLESTLLPKLFDDIPWSNYHDTQDPVSGHLDYYDKVRNVDCRFIPEGEVKFPALLPFTHSRYWTHNPMYADILVRHLL